MGQRPVERLLEQLATHPALLQAVQGRQGQGRQRQRQGQGWQGFHSVERVGQG